MNISKEAMVDTLHKKNLVSTTDNMEEWTKRQIAERMDVRISATNYVSQTAFHEACDQRKEKGDKL